MRPGKQQGRYPIFGGKALQDCYILTFKRFKPIPAPVAVTQGNGRVQPFLHRREGRIRVPIALRLAGNGHPDALIGFVRREEGYGRLVSEMASGNNQVLQGASQADVQLPVLGVGHG
jgi:hypothetical protein